MAFTKHTQNLPDELRQICHQVETLVSAPNSPFRQHNNAITTTDLSQAYCGIIIKNAFPSGEGGKIFLLSSAQPKNQKATVKKVEALEGISPLVLTPHEWTACLSKVRIHSNYELRKTGNDTHALYRRNDEPQREHIVAEQNLDFFGAFSEKLNSDVKFEKDQDLTVPLFLAFVGENPQMSSIHRTDMFGTLTKIPYSQVVGALSDFREITQSWCSRKENRTDVQTNVAALLPRLSADLPKNWMDKVIESYTANSSNAVTQPAVRPRSKYVICNNIQSLIKEGYQLYANLNDEKINMFDSHAIRNTLEQAQNVNVHLPAEQLVNCEAVLLTHLEKMRACQHTPETRHAAVFSQYQVEVGRYQELRSNTVQYRLLTANAGFANAAPKKLGIEANTLLLSHELAETIRKNQALAQHQCDHE